MKTKLWKIESSAQAHSSHAGSRTMDGRSVPPQYTFPSPLLVHSCMELAFWTIPSLWARLIKDTQNDTWISLWQKAHDKCLISTRAVQLGTDYLNAYVGNPLLCSCQVALPPVPRQGQIPENYGSLSAEVAVSPQNTAPPPSLGMLQYIPCRADTLAASTPFASHITNIKAEGYLQLDRCELKISSCWGNHSASTGLCNSISKL